MYTKNLEKEGFVINTYNRCVANKMIYRKQYTVVWYVDDDKISDKDLKVVTNAMNLMIFWLFDSD